MEVKPRPASPDEMPNFSIQATESIQERWPRTLKNGDMFGLFDAMGDVKDPALTPGGLFYRDTRHLSGLEFLIAGHRPLLLSSAVENDNVVLTVDLSNPDVYDNGTIVLPRESLHVRRSKFLWDGTCYERFVIHNFDARTRRCWLTFNFQADFRDLFEIRGMQRPLRGAVKSERTDESLTFRYQGLDGIVRHTEIRLDPRPNKLNEKQALYALDLRSGERLAIILTVRCVGEEGKPPVFSKPYRAARRAAQTARRLGGTVTSSNALANRMLHRASADLSMLTTDTAYGPYPYAGTPWFSTPFGRDGIITALQVLWIDPSLAKGVLKYLAHTQSTISDPHADAEPGKILHETRACEMANLGEVPFGRYYGSVDSTPLFVLLAARYYQRTGDQATIRALWPHLKAALAWIDTYGDLDGDGFVEYYQERESGLVNQGWKDSLDSVFHVDGQLATGPIALCEVQAYVHAAKQGAALLARMLGEHDYANVLESSAQTLREEFEKHFWCENIGVYAIALDGAKRPCRVRTSNAGQVLFCGIASANRAARLAETLMAPEMFSGWGVRTLAADAPRFNPMSYHDGSVWPHDNALIALGLGRYGFKRAASAIFCGMFEASCHMDLMRFPELFCGFSRRRGIAPTLYPVACQPQAWASAVPFALLEACLGVVCDYERRELRFNDPFLPRFLEEVRIRNLTLGDGSADLCLRRTDKGTEVAIVAQSGDIAIRIAR